MQYLNKMSPSPNTEKKREKIENQNTYYIK